MPDILRDPLWSYELFALLVLYPGWRIFRRAGFPGWWVLLCLVPMAGSTLCAAVLALKPWPAGQAWPRKRARP